MRGTHIYRNFKSIMTLKTQNHVLENISILNFGKNPFMFRETQEKICLKLKF